MTPASREPSSRAGWALAVWLLSQVVALALCGARIKFSARYPTVAGQLSTSVVIITQVVVASLIWPVLTANATLAIIAVATAWPLAQLSAFLADLNFSQWVFAELFASLWLI